MRLMQKKANLAFSAIILFGLAQPARSNAQSVTVNAATTYQTMDGFGGQTWTFADSLTSTQANQFFSPTSGIGLEIVRTANTYDGGIPDLTTLQEAVALGAQVELSIQSPPCNLKHSYVDLGESCTVSWGDYGNQPAAFADGTAGNSGVCFANSLSLDGSGGAFDQYGTYLVNTIDNFRSSGIPIAYLDVQNEGNMQNSSVGACLWTSGSLYEDFIKNYLGPKLAAAGLSSVKVMLGPAYNWFDSDYVSACLNDSGCAQYVSIASGHGYGYPYTPYAYPLGTSGGRHLWLSETGSQSQAYDGSIGDALVWAKNINDFLTVANVSGIEWWELSYTTASSGGLPNGGLTDQNLNPAKRFYAEGNWSKFVRSGWVRILATTNPQTGVYVTAFMSQSSGAFAIVAINQNSGSVSQPFSLSGLSASSITPYITDANNNLASQASVALSGDTFTATLTAQSVTTFATSSSGPPPPTQLIGTVVD